MRCQMPNACQTMYVNFNDFIKIIAFLSEYIKKTIKTILGSIYLCIYLTQPAFTSSKLTIETLEQGEQYIQSQQ